MVPSPKWLFPWFLWFLYIFMVPSPEGLINLTVFLLSWKHPPSKNPPSFGRNWRHMRPFMLFFTSCIHPTLEPFFNMTFALPFVIAVGRHTPTAIHKDVTQHLFSPGFCSTCHQHHRSSISTSTQWLQVRRRVYEKWSSLVDESDGMPAWIPSMVHHWCLLFWRHTQMGLSIHGGIN